MLVAEILSVAAWARSRREGERIRRRIRRKF
jgi:hypothetical protein